MAIPGGPRLEAPGMATSDPNWAEIVTAVSTAVGAIGLLSALFAALFAAKQVRELEKSRQSALAADFLRRWDEADLVETRHLIGQFETPEQLSTEFQKYVASNSMQAFVLYRELDYFEQLAALEHMGAFDTELIKLLLGQRLIDRFEMWKPSLDALGTDPYPLFAALVARMRHELGVPAEGVAPSRRG
jgi:hypothetical protein